MPTPGVGGLASSSNGQVAADPARHAPVCINDVFLLRAGVVQHLPARVSREFAAVLTGAINRYCALQDHDTLFGVLALPKLCLRSVPTKGKFSITELEMALSRRLSMFEAGEWLALWEEAKLDAAARDLVETRSVKRARMAADQFDQGTLRQTRTLVGEGAPAKAVQSLLSQGLL